ncbi:single-stranded DNA-binding protein [Mucilaginibacter terrae]|uniref:Single-strand DNA-binding protein n=1 Tax=Mucilaginibacter terrae TaxID=1955052 RepID=A0ABU3H0L1_9SPHI|nr:single-stranded DNA-binding protein [Mucilaginibacter terrae]MDT3405555.1 single-strand DNA-binding protein [Mucilaginibacter terrae]
MSNDGINKVLLAGQITAEPRWHDEGNERMLCFTLTTKEIIFSQKEDIEHLENHRIKIPEKSHALKRFTFKKDDIVFVQGKLHTRSFIDAENIKRYKTEVIANQVDRHAPEIPTAAQMRTVDFG